MSLLLFSAGLIFISYVVREFLVTIARSDRVRFQLRVALIQIAIRFERRGEVIARRAIEKAVRIADAERKLAATAQKAKVPVNRRSFLVDLLLPMAIAKDVQANLDEVTPIWVAQYGEPNANFIRAVQIAWIVMGHWSRPVAKIVKQFVGL